ncbi:MAG: hypothetical protein ABIE94_03430 [archaeon]
MKKRSVVLLVVMALFIISSSLVLGLDAEEKKIYDKWHNSGDYFQIDTDLYNLRLNPNDFSKIVFYRNGEGFMINNGSCEHSLMYKFCFENSTWDDEKMTINDNGITEPGLHIIIYELAPDRPVIEIERTIPKKSLELGEQLHITINISNVGRQAATDLVYKETVPDGFVVVSSDLLKAGNTLTITKAIGALSYRIIGFTIKPVNYTSHMFQGKARYSYEGVAYTENTTEVNISVAKPYKFTYTLTPVSVNIDTTSTFKISVQNKETDDTFRIDNLYFEVPRDLEVYPPHGIYKISPTEYTYSGVVYPERTKDYDIRLKAPYTGTYEIRGKMEGYMNQHYFKENFAKNLTIKVDKINGLIHPNYESVRAGKPVKIRVYFENNDDANSYYDVNATLSSELFTEQIYEEKILDFQLKQVFLKQYNTPYSTRIKTIPIRLNGTYRSQSGELFAFNTERTLTLTPVNQSFTLTQTVDKESVARGGNVTIAVFVKNLNDDPEFNLEVKETFPIELDVFQGETSAKINIQGNENKQAYIYKFRVPMDYPFNVITIQSDLDAPSKLYTTQQSTNITVTGPLGEEEEEEEQEPETPEDNQTKEPIQPPEEKKKGFFTKFIDEIEKFFKTLFS